MGVYIPYTRLPSAYQEVEYIQSSGTQYFIVGTSFKTSYKSVTDFQMTQTGGDQVVIGFNLHPYRYGINAYASKFKVITGGGSWSNTISEDTNRHTLTIDKSTATVDGNNYTISGYTNITVNGGIGVFAHNDEGAGNYFARVKIYNLEIYNENGTLIYHLVPCYRKSDSVIGMYDLVNNVFYTNQGTGTFTKGADVYISELKNAYIGGYQEGWQPGANTVAYYPLTADYTDQSGNGRNLTNYGTTITTLDGVKCCYFNLNYAYYGGNSNITVTEFTLNVWVKYTGAIQEYVFTMGGSVGGNVDLKGNALSYYYNSNNYRDQSMTSALGNVWTNVVIVKTNGTAYLYKNGTLDVSHSIGGTIFRNRAIAANSIGGSGNKSTGYISNIIIENKARTAQEISDYYNQTKANYGL